MYVHTKSLHSQNSYPSDKAKGLSPTKGAPSASINTSLVAVGTTDVK